MLAHLPSGRKISYLDFGRGLPVVLLHAFPLAKEMWDLQINEFAEKYRMIVLDAPGFGETDPFPVAPSVEANADDANALLDALGIEGPVVLGGCSMGGYASLAFARKYPGRLRGLILADTKAEPDDEAGKIKRGEMIQLANEQGSDAVLEKMLPMLLAPLSRESRPEVVATVRALGTGQKVKTITNALTALRDRPDSRSVLADIRVPTLVIGGEHDVVCSPEVMGGMAAKITGAKHVVVPAAGHLANLEEPGIFNEALEQFLNKL